MLDSPRRVYVIDDDASIRRAVRRLLLARGFAVDVYESSQAFLGQQPDGPGCVLLDLQLPDLPGLELLRQLGSPAGALRVVILSGHADVPAAVSAMKLGAIDLLAKPVDDEVLIAAVSTACRLSTEAWTLERERNLVIRALAALTPRELEVAWMVSRGLLNKQIAYDLGIAERTVKGHRGNVTRKLGVQSVADLLRLLDASSQSPPLAVQRFLTAAESTWRAHPCTG